MRSGLKRNKTLKKRVERETNKEEREQNIKVLRNRRGLCRISFHKHELLNFLKHRAASAPLCNLIEAVTALMVETGYLPVDQPTLKYNVIEKHNANLTRSFQDWSPLDMPGFPRAASTLHSKRLQDGSILIHLKPKNIKDRGVLPIGSF